jgi:glycogen debranching enzyme
MTTSAFPVTIPPTVRGRSFARTAPDGSLDGSADRGIYSHDVRMIRRAEAFGAGREHPIIPQIAVDADGAAMRFTVPNVRPGEGVMLVVEVDGEDTFAIRHMHADAGAPQSAGLGLGEVRPEARVLLHASCEDGATLEHVDGVAMATGPIPADGTPRTAAWRWRRSNTATGVSDIVVELRVGWSVLSDVTPARPRSYEELANSHRVEIGHWLSERPAVEAAPRDVQRVLERAMADLATLRVDGDDGVVLAAGLPWYMTVVGRESMLAAWMMLPVDPRLAPATLRHLARHQAKHYDPSVDAEPGKILHEERHGVVARRWHERYYGSIDSTPLFVVLLGEVWKWSGDDRIALELEAAARDAVAWIEARLDEDDLGLLAFQRRADRGVDIHSWKDSLHSQRDRTGRVASGRIRPIEAQGYAVAALTAAADLAEGVWNDLNCARGWRALAQELSRRVLKHYEVTVPVSVLEEDDPRSGGFLAMALDEAGVPLDSLSSNIGHLLWSRAIPDPAIAQRTARQLLDPALWSGWGVRTMSTLDDGYSPRSQHCGSVWPHDTAICVAGMAGAAHALASQVGESLFAAGAAMDDAHLPELLSGSQRGPRDRAPDPQEVGCTPQAWAAASPFMVLRALLGLEATRNGELVSTVDSAPAFLRGFDWRGVHALGRRWNVSVDESGAISVYAA